MKKDENVLCFPADMFTSKFEFEHDDKEFKFESLDKKLAKRITYMPRSKVEHDLRWRHAIGYTLLLKQAERLADCEFYIYERKGSEKRLQGQFSIGIGGHITDEDMRDRLETQVKVGSLREVREEAGINPSHFSLIPIGTILSSASEVDMVHVGFLWILRTDNVGTSHEISGGRWMKYSIIRMKYGKVLESWSKIALDKYRDFFRHRDSYIAKYKVEHDGRNPGIIPTYSDEDDLIPSEEAENVE